MKLSLPYQEFSRYVQHQAETFYPDKNKLSRKEFKLAFDFALERVEFCFSHIKSELYCQNGEGYLNHLHSDQYAMFLWFLSNSIWHLLKNDVNANKIFCLNKALNGISCNFTTEMPPIFLWLHTVGTVLGKATYSDYFVACQGCTVGAQKGEYPILGKCVGLLPYSAVIGNSRVFDEVTVGIRSVVYEQDVLFRKIVYTDKSGSLQIREHKNSWAKTFFKM